jgi:hypothetical protein
MAFGLQIKNANSEIVIDGNYANYRIVQKGTTTTQVDLPGTGGKAMKIVFSPQLPLNSFPLIFARGISGTNYNAMGNVIVYKNSGNTAYAGALITIWRDPGTPITSMEYVITIPSFSVSGSYGTYGLQVYNSSGQLVYHSSAKYANIYNAYTWSDGASWSLGTPPSGKKWYPQVSGIQGAKFVVEYDFIFFYTMWRCGVQINTSNVISNQYIYAGFATNGNQNTGIYYSIPSGMKFCVISD